MSSPLHFQRATTVAAAVRAGERSPEAVVEEHLDRIANRNDELTAYVTVLGDRARERARKIGASIDDGSDPGPLAGVPVAVKDLYGFVAGVRNTFGSVPLADTVADEDATLVGRIKDAGGIVLGKTNTPELGHKATTDNALFGPTSTPFAPRMNAGGSSGGSAAAVAADLAMLGHGSDGGGSIRIPAAFCGVYGYKASHRRVPNRERPDAFGGIAPYTHHGPLARSVGDAALLLDVITGPHPDDPLSLPDDGTDYRAAVDRPIDDLSVAYSPTFDVFPVASVVRDIVDDAVGAFVDAGADVVEASPDIPYTHGELSKAWTTLHKYLLAKTNESFTRTHGVDLLSDHREEMAPELVRQMAAGYEADPMDRFQADAVRTDVFDAIQSVLADHDLLVTPTLAVPAVPNDSTLNGHVVGPSTVAGEPVSPYLGWCLTYPINFTGHPAASIPAGFTNEGMPVGLQIVGRRFGDESVLAASGAFERERPWHDAYAELDG